MDVLHHPRFADLSAAVSTVSELLKLTNEAQLWAQAVGLLATCCDADGAAVVEQVSEHRMVFHSVDGWRTRTGVVLPFAPDSQAEHTFAAQRVIVSHDMASDGRFVAAAPLIREGFRSSVSIGVELLLGERVILGAYDRQPNRFGSAEIEVFSAVAMLIGAAAGTVRNRAVLHRNARHDPLTGLLNRGVLLELLHEERDAGRPSTVLLIDLDGFKSVNDRYGHDVGDVVLATTADRISRALPLSTRVGRLGGDEFLILTGTADAAQLARTARRVVGLIEELMQVDGHHIQISASVGAAGRQAHDPDVAGLLRRADRLMYQAKASGSGSVRVADVEVASRRIVSTVPTRTPLPERALLDIDEAIAGLQVLHQPIVDAFSGQVVGLEALVRGPAGARLEMPDLLFAQATTHGRLGELEMRAKELAFKIGAPEHVSLFVNFEPGVLTEPEWMAQLIQIWTATAPDCQVVAEMTERDVLKAPGRMLQAIEACRKLGWKIALDDIGSSAETLMALKLLQPDVVKLDLTLIDAKNQTHAARVAAAVASYRDLRGDDPVLVVAEGVEDISQARRAGVLGADALQGFLYCRPAPFTDLDAIVAGGVPSELLSGDAGVDNDGYRIATKRDLLHLSRHVESIVTTPDSVVLAALQSSRFLTERTSGQYTALARRAGFVALLGADLTRVHGRSIGGVRLGDIPAGDPLLDCWFVIAMSPHGSLALLAEEMESALPPKNEMDRRFRFRLTTDGRAAKAAAQSLLAHL